MSLKERVTENLGLKALSLFLALLLWLSVTAGTEGEAELTVPVRFNNLAPQLTLEKEGPASLDLRIAGPKLLLMRLDRERPAAILDLKGVGEGSVAFTALERTVSLPVGLRVVRIYPSAIELKLAKKRNVSSGL